MSDYQQGQPITISDTFRLDGVATNPTQVVYTILGPDGTTDTYTWPGDPEITNSGAGVFELALSPPSLPGPYQYDVDATGTVVASRRGQFNIIPNAQSSALVDWAVSGPCSPWCSSQSIWECCGSPMETIDGVECAVDMTAYAQEASELLFEMSGRLFSGACEQTVRPCGVSACGVQVLSRGHLVWSGASWWTMDARRACGCSAIPTVRLSGYPVREITEVKIDGSVIDPDTYRLDQRRNLVRLRDPATGDVLGWPSCQALDLPDTEDGTFSVTYRYGQDPPLNGVHAATQLGCEIYRSCNGGECALPTGTTRVTRHGVVIEKMAFAAWGLQNGIWRTGITMVDAFLNAYQPHGQRRRPVVWSPASHLRFARRVGQ